MGARPPLPPPPPSELPFSMRPEADFLRPGLWCPFDAAVDAADDGEVTFAVVVAEDEDLLFLCMLSSRMSSERLSAREAETDRDYY